MPRQWVWAMARPPAAAVSSRKSRRWVASGVATSPKVIGTELETARSRMRPSARDRTSGSRGHHAAVCSFKDARPELGHDPDQCPNLVPRGESRGDRSVVGGLVVHDARRREPDRPRPQRIVELPAHEL